MFDNGDGVFLGSYITQGIRNMALATPNNITRLIDAGKDIAPTSEWWIDHPTPQEIKDALIAPAINDPGGDGLCIKRLGIPRMMTNSNVGYDVIPSLSSFSGPQDRLLVAWYELQVNEDQSAFDSHMAQAKSDFLTGDWATDFAMIGGGNSYRQHAAMLSLDWIVWDDLDEFETAFAVVLDVLENKKGGDTLLTDRDWETPI